MKKKIDKILTPSGDALCYIYIYIFIFFLFAHSIQLDNGVTSMCVDMDRGVRGSRARNTYKENYETVVHGVH